MVIHHHTKFGIKKKELSGSRGTEWTERDTGTELQMDRQSDSNIPPCIYRGEGDNKFSRKVLLFKPHTLQKQARFVTLRGQIPSGLG